MVVLLSIDNFLKKEIVKKTGSTSDLSDVKRDAFITELRIFRLKHENATFNFFISNLNDRSIGNIAEQWFDYHYQDECLTTVLLDAKKPNTEKTENLLMNFAHELDPDVPMIDSKDDKKLHLLITDDLDDFEFGNNLGVRTLLLENYYKKSSLGLTFDEISQYISLCLNHPEYNFNNYLI